MKTLRNLFLLPAVCCLSVSLMAAGSLDGVSIKMDEGDFIYQSAPFPSCHASTIVETSDGMLAAWFGGTYEKHPDVSIYTSAYRNGKWSEPVMVADGVENKLIRNPTWNPVLFKRDNGDIILYYKVGPSVTKWVGVYKISTDEGKTWSKELRIPDNLLGPIKNKPVKSPDGGILYPTSVEDNLGWRVYMEHSKQDLSDWGKVTLDNNGFNAIQPSVLFYPGGKMQILCRSKENKVVESWSGDGGKTWSKMEATSLPNPNSGTDAVTTKEGVQLIIYNPLIRGEKYPQGRERLNIAASYDGKTWKDLIVLEDQKDGEYSYPAIIQAEDGSVWITYTYRREKVKYAKLKLTVK